MVVQIGGPLLILLLVVGLSVAIFQALTQINEATWASSLRLWSSVGL